MIQLEQVRNYFPATVRDNTAFGKHMIKEYLQLAICGISTLKQLKSVTAEKLKR